MGRGGKERNDSRIIDRMTDVLICKPISIWTFFEHSVFVSLSSEDSSFRAWLEMNYTVTLSLSRPRLLEVLWRSSSPSSAQRKSIAKPRSDLAETVDGRWIR